MAIHFPIALLIIGFLFELAAFFYKGSFFRQAAFYLLLLGTLGTIASYLTGNAAGEGMEEGALAKAMEQHEEAATITLWLSCAVAVIYLAMAIFKYQKTWARIISILLFAAIIVSVARTGYMGGQLVYKHGAGVELALPDFTNPEKED